MVKFLVLGVLHLYLPSPNVSMYLTLSIGTHPRAYPERTLVYIEIPRCDTKGVGEYEVAVTSERTSRKMRPDVETTAGSKA